MNVNVRWNLLFCLILILISEALRNKNNEVENIYRYKYVFLCISAQTRFNSTLSSDRVLSQLLYIINLAELTARKSLLRAFGNSDKLRFGGE